MFVLRPFLTLLFEFHHFSISFTPRVGFIVRGTNTLAWLFRNPAVSTTELLFNFERRYSRESRANGKVWQIFITRCCVVTLDIFFTWNENFLQIIFQDFCRNLFCYRIICQTGARVDFMYRTQWTLFNWNAFPKPNCVVMIKKVIRSSFVTLVSCVSEMRRTIGWPHVVVRVRGNATNQRSTFCGNFENLSLEHNAHSREPRENWKYRKLTRSNDFSYQQALSINIRKYSWNSLLSSVRWTNSASLSFRKAFSQ